MIRARTFELLALLVSAEKLLSDSTGADYVEVSETLRRLRRTIPELPWVHEDKSHPGVATTYLMAARIHKIISGLEQPVAALCVNADLNCPQFEGGAQAGFQSFDAPTAK